MCLEKFLIMKISYNWLKDYINIDLPPKEVADILTAIGLEIKKVEKYESVKGGLEGLVVGKVLTCEKHPQADKLSLTTVDIGGKVLPIVCGAPNVAEGQKVVVAPVGVTIYPIEGEPIKMKKAKIRGAVSEGMIVAEDEIGVGTNHDGIIVLDDNAEVGKPAKEYFDIYEDWIFEIDLTPNRQDAMSHFGVARDLYVYLKTNTDLDVELKLPDISDFQIDNEDLTIPVQVNKPEAAPRYSGITFTNLEVKESPKWLQNRLKAIGQKPINNVVDITNYVLHEIGHPLHAFDADKIKGKKVVVDTVENGTEFTLLDGKTIELTDKDLMICDAEHTPMCIGGVMGGLNTGVKEETKNVFLESAFFNPVWIRKTAKRYGISTDASYRFERGVDINGTLWALKRAATLIKKYAGGKISSQIQDFYPNPIDAFDTELSYSQLDKLVGIKLNRYLVKNILEDLEIAIVEETDEKLKLKVPTYRYDVRREADVIEEIIRIYGYNNFPESKKLKVELFYQEEDPTFKYQYQITDYLVGRGFTEIMSLSLTKEDYYQGLTTYSPDKLVRLYNPLSKDLAVMRQTMLFGGLEAIIRNINNQNPNLSLFEFGKIYYVQNPQASGVEKYAEKSRLALWSTGFTSEENWITKPTKADYFYLKSELEGIFKKLGFNIDDFKTQTVENELFNYATEYKLNDKTIAILGSVNIKILRNFEIEQEVFFAEIDFDRILELIPPTPQFKAIPKYPKVRRDLSMLLDKNIPFQKVKEVVQSVNKGLIKEVNIFDVYESDKLPEGKKSYAISIIMQSENKTLKDKEIDKLIKKIIYNLENKLGAQIRK